MKKILFSITVLVYCLVIGISGKAQKTHAPAEVQRSFNDHFKNADIARWVSIQDSYVATFTQGAEYKDAYFTDDGEFKGIGHYITIDLLPASVQEKLTASYSNYELNELYQFDCVETGTCFFAVLENQKNQLTVKMDATGDVTYSKRNKIKGIQKINEPLLALKDKK